MGRESSRPCAIPSCHSVGSVRERERSRKARVTGRRRPHTFVSLQVYGVPVCSSAIQARWAKGQ